jgi:hypothetical protein
VQQYQALVPRIVTQRLVRQLNKALEACATSNHSQLTMLVAQRRFDATTRQPYQQLGQPVDAQ